MGFIVPLYSEIILKAHTGQIKESEIEEREKLSNRNITSNSKPYH